VKPSIRSLVFFTLFYLYLCFEVDLCLVYHGNGAIVRWPVFFRGWQFFQPFLSYPGGLIEYLAAFLFQFFHYSWVGSIVVTVLAWLMCECTDRYVAVLNAPQLRPVRFVPPVLVLVLYTQYTYNLATIVAAAAALLFACLYVRFAPKSTWLRLVIYLILSTVLYTAGGGAFLIFAGLCALYEGLFMGRWRSGLVQASSGFAIPLGLGVFAFKTSVAEAFNSMLPFSWKTGSEDVLHEGLVLTAIHLLCFFLPLTALGLGLWRLVAASRRAGVAPVAAAAGTAQEKPKRAALRSRAAAETAALRSMAQGAHRVGGSYSWYAGRPGLKWAFETMVLIVVAASAVLLTRDSRIKTLCAVDYYSCNRMWPQVLEAAVDYPDNLFVMHAVNRALYHTGRLGWEMFSRPQHSDLLFLTAEGTSAQHWRRFGMYMDLGLFNLAEKSVSESLEQLGERPVVLQQLALINMVKGNMGAARVYLGALAKTLFYSGWANDCLGRIKLDPDLSQDEEIGRLRRLKLEKDCSFIAYKLEGTASDFEPLLLDLLDKDRQNRAAFEYLMAYYLLTKQLDKFTQNVGRLNDFDYPRIPRHYEEAILIAQNLTDRKLDLKGRAVSRESQQRFNDCLEILRRHHGDKQPAFDDLVREQRDSYVFYYLYAEIQE
jgi:hypothetical protein